MSPTVRNNISAANSTVASTTVVIVATGADTPWSVTARAPSKNPPTCEKGKQLAAALCAAQNAKMA